MSKAERVIKEVTEAGKFSREKIKSVVTAVHVAPADAGWEVKKTGRERVAEHFTSKEAAVDYGKNISRDNGVDLIVHTKDGKIHFIELKDEKTEN